MSSSRLSLALRGSSRNVGRYALALLIALLCFNGLVALRAWHQAYAVSPQWAGEVERKGSGRGWPAVVAAAAETFGDHTFASKELFYDEIAAVVKSGKRFALAADKGVKEYRAAVTNRNVYQARFVERLEAIDDEFATRSKGLEDVRRDIVAKRIERAEAKDEQKRKDLAKDLAELEASRVLISRELTNLNTERLTIESVHAKRLDAEEKKISSAELRIRSAIDSGAGFARPVAGTLATFIGETRALQIGDESNAWHIVYIVVWYGLEALIVLALCLIVVPWLLRLSGNADPNEVKPGFITWLRNLLARVLGPRVAAGAGQVARALMAVAVTATAAVGVAAAAGEQPPVVPVVQHEPASAEPRDTQRDMKPQGETTNDEDEKNKLAEELAKKIEAQATALATQNQTLKDQATLIDNLKTELDKVADAAGKTKTKADELERDATQITANVYGLASGAQSAKTSLQNLNATIDTLTRTTGSIMLANAGATRQLDQSLTRLQLATAATANGAADVSAKVVTAENKLSAVDRDILRVSTVRDGWLLPLNPFAKYQVTGETIRIVKHALATPNEGPAANVLSVLQGFVGREPEPIWRFERPLTNSATPEAQALMKDLMPLILKASRFKGAPNVK